jgi:hypothetical protein
MKVDRIAKRVADWIGRSQGAQATLRHINKNPAIFSAVVSFGLASLLRPAAIGVLPFKNNKDKKCSQASAVSAGLIELASTTAVFMPLNNSIEKTSKSLYSSKGTFYEGNNVALRQFKSVTNRGAKMLFIIPMSLARFALIKPLLNTMFKEKPKKVGERKLDKWA